MASELASMLDLGRLKRSWVFGGGGGGGLLGGLFGGAGGGVPYMAFSRHTSTTTKSSDANVTVSATTANVLTKHWQWKVPAGHSFSIPAGAGSFWVKPKAAGAPGATVNGVYQVRVMDPLETTIRNYVSVSSNLFSETAADETDVTKQPPLPKQLDAGSEDLLQLWIDGDAVAAAPTTDVGTAVMSIWFKGTFR